MFIYREVMAAGNLGTKMCKIGAERKRRRLTATSSRVAAGTEVLAQEQVIEKVDTFKYLDRMLYFEYSDWTAVDRNLHRAQRRWIRSPVYCAKRGQIP